MPMSDAIQSQPSALGLFILARKARSLDVIREELASSSLKFGHEVAESLRRPLLSSAARLALQREGASSLSDQARSSFKRTRIIAVG